MSQIDVVKTNRVTLVLDETTTLADVSEWLSAAEENYDRDFRVIRVGAGSDGTTVRLFATDEV